MAARIRGRGGISGCENSRLNSLVREVRLFGIVSNLEGKEIR